VGNATLVRFFSLHYVLPFIILGLILLHLILLHIVGSTNPLQITSESKIPLHPYYIVKDLFATSVAILAFIILVYFYPNILGHADNFIPANPLVTPAHIVPE
jgi:ubiquinol-cytochrome c reductase cytochrome b/c1 subunit